MQLENRTVLLARPETTYNVDSIGPNLSSIPSPYVTDAMEVGDLDVRVNGEVLTRAIYSPSLSQAQTGTGRMLLQLTFKAEFKASGALGVAPRIGRLLKACGMQETIIASSAAANISDAVPGENNASSAAAAILASLTGATNKTTAPTSRFDAYRVTVTTGGAAGTAKFVVTGTGFPEGDTSVLPSLAHSVYSNSAAGVVTIGGTAVAPVITFSGTWARDEFIELLVGGVRFYYQVATGNTVTDIATAFRNQLLADGRFTGTTNASGVLTVTLTAGTASGGAGDWTTTAGNNVVTLGQSGAVVTIPTWTGSVTAGEYWDIKLLRPGVRYDPVSDNMTSLTFYTFLDGSLFKVTGSRGTVTGEGTAGQYSMLSFTFTGVYNDPIDGALPTGLVFEKSKPFKVELAQLAINGFGNACASRFSFDLANTVEAKDCINASEGYDEIRITGRAPTAGADPQAEKPSIMNPWNFMRREKTTRYHVAVGIRGGVGNIARFQADNATLRDVPFANRNNIRAYDFQMSLARVTPSGNDELFFHFG